MRYGVAALLFTIPALTLATETAPHITPILSTTTTITGQRLELPDQPEVRASIVELAPGASLPVHQHPYQRYAYILEGDVTVTFPDEEKTFVSKAGDFIVEGREHWHFGVNKGTKPVRLLVIDHVPVGAETNTIKQSR